MLFKEDDKFDESAALGNLIETYGQVKEAVTASESGQKKRKVVDKDAGDETVNTATAEKDEKDEKAKKIRASETVAVNFTSLFGNLLFFCLA